MKVNITTTRGTRHVQQCKTLEEALDFVNFFLKINLFPENVRRITVTDPSSKVLAAWEGGTRTL